MAEESHQSAVPAPTPSVRRAIGPYAIECPIGRGGMGEVFLAHDTRLGREVAIKLVGERFAGASPDPNQLLREARAAARLSHPHIAIVHDVLEVDGQAAIVMEYLRGESLAQRLRRGPVPVDEALRIATQVTSAVAHAHRNNVLHCDLKPGNVFLTEDGTAKVLDFGLARPLHATGDDSRASIGASPLMVRLGAGTPAYMAPEHLGGGPIDARADVYSLGVTLDEMLAGRPRAAAPVLDPSATTVLAPGTVDFDAVPPAVRAIVARATAPQPAARYASAAEMNAALAGLTSRSRGVAWRSRRVFVPLLAALLLVGGLTGAAWRLMRPAGGDGASPPVLAVLPLSAADERDASQKYLAAGVTEMLTSELANSSRLVVVSAASAAGAAGRLKDPIAIARELGATLLLTGALERHGNQLRVSLAIFDVKSATSKDAGSVDAPLSDVAGRRFPLLDALRDRLALSGLQVDAPAPSSIAQVGQETLEEYARGRELLAQGSLDEALTFFERAVAREPPFALAHAGAGETSWRKYLTTRDPVWAGRAQAAAFEAMRLAPGEAAVRYTAAVVLNGTGRRREAEDEARRAIELQPANDDAHRLLGQIYAGTDRFEAAKTEFETAIALRPGYAGNYHALGIACFDNGRFEDAIAAFERDTELRPDASAFQALGTSYHALGRLDQALANYERAIAIKPNAYAYSNIGMIHHVNGRYREAVAAYEQAARVDPSNAITYRNIGDSMMKAGDRRQARLAYQHAIDLAGGQLKVNSRDGKLISLQAVCEAKMDHRAVAIARIRQAIKAAPDDSEVLYQAGVVYALVGNPADAIAFLRKAIAHGYSTSVLAEDDDLSSLRKSAQFEALVKDNAASPGVR